MVIFYSYVELPEGIFKKKGDLIPNPNMQALLAPSLVEHVVHKCSNTPSLVVVRYSSTCLLFTNIVICMIK